MEEIHRRLEEIHRGERILEEIHRSERILEETQRSEGPQPIETTTLYKTDFWGESLARLLCAVIVLKEYTFGNDDLFAAEYSPLYRRVVHTAYAIDGNQAIFSAPVMGELLTLAISYLATEKSIRLDSEKPYADKRHLLMGQIVDEMEKIVKELTLNKEIIVMDNGQRFIKPISSGAIARIVEPLMRKLVHEFLLTNLPEEDKKQFNYLLGHLHRIASTIGSDATVKVDAITKDIINWYDYNQEPLKRLAMSFHQGAQSADSAWNRMSLQMETFMSMFLFIKVRRNWGVGHGGHKNLRNLSDVEKDILLRGEERK